MAFFITPVRDMLEEPGILKYYGRFASHDDAAQLLVDHGVRPSLHEGEFAYYGSPLCLWTKDGEPKVKIGWGLYIRHIRVFSQRCDVRPASELIPCLANGNF